MAFQNIKDLRFAKAKPQKYFIDANVWIYVLDSFSTLSNTENAYIEFFYSIIEFEGETKPKIIMNSLLLSEIINTYMRQVALNQYRIEKGGKIDKVDFKRDYRPTEHYKKFYSSVCDDIKGYRDSIEVVDDNFIGNKPFEILQEKKLNADFNDYYYYLICKNIKQQSTVSIVTHDGDFKFEDIEIITTNQALKNLITYTK